MSDNWRPPLMRMRAACVGAGIHVYVEGFVFFFFFFLVFARAHRLLIEPGRETEKLIIVSLPSVTKHMLLFDCNHMQVGFGWTNGVILDFLRVYGKNLTAPGQPTPTNQPEKPTPANQPDHRLSTNDIIAIVVSSILFLVCVLTLLKLCKSSKRWSHRKGDFSLLAQNFEPIDNKEDWLDARRFNHHKKMM